MKYTYSNEQIFCETTLLDFIWQKGNGGRQTANGERQTALTIQNIRSAAGAGQNSKKLFSRHNTFNPIPFGY